MVERTFISLPSQLQLIERLQHLIYLSSSLIFVSGEAGAGKSTLMENLSNSLPLSLQQVYITLSSSPSIAKIRQQIIVQLYDKPLFSSEDKLLETLSRLALQTGLPHPKNRLIIIDNAQYLPEKFILELCELFSVINTDAESNCNVLLLADDINNQSQIKYIKQNLSKDSQSLFNQVELSVPILSAQEAKALLQHNFQQAEYRPQLQHQDALNSQLRSCRGNPQKISQLADDLSQGLIEPMVNSWVKTRLPALLLMFVMVALVSVIAVYLYPKFIPASVAEDFVVDHDITNNVALRAENERDNTASITSTLEQTHEPLAGVWAVQNTEIENHENTVGISDETVQQVMGSGQQLVEVTVLAETAKNENIALVTHPEEEPLLKIQQQSYDDIALLSIHHNENKVAQQREPEEALAIDLIVEQISSNTLLISESTMIVKKSDTDVLLILTPTEVLLSKPVNHYTLQLSAMSSEASLELFKKQNNLPQANIFVYKKIVQSKQLFIVAYGEYDTLQSAQLAAESLPTPFKGMTTWIKKWQVVHNDLRLNNE